MSVLVRQNNLFAAEDFTKVYRAFSEINFRAYDFDTIRSALIEYIRTNFPEDFNDYIESSEFIAIIELLAYLGQSLSFRIDLNSRENFLDTAERKESVLRLARLLSYQPRRNLPASGLFKLTAVQTNEPLRDSLGRQLNNVPVFWNDPNNEDSFEQFITILNSAFNPSNRFGKPVKSSTIGGIETDLYQFNNVTGFEVAFPLNLTINGERLPFEVVNVDFDDEEFLFEPHPNPDNLFQILNRNDGRGLDSPNTGFFLFFKQGSLDFIDTRFDQPVENRVFEIDRVNINETDIFVQNIDEQGNVLSEWTKVPAVVGNNIIFNSINLNEREIFSVITGVDDKVTIRFADGNFGDVPTGIFRFWFRTSIGRRFAVRPQDAQNLAIEVPYFNTAGQRFTVRLFFGLEETVDNSTPAETIDQIKLRAPQVFFTQNRMVNNEDYNVFPLTRGNEILKIKAINRTHAGHSRFIDINDPTGTHQNVVVFGEDGVIYREDEPRSVEVDLTTGITEEEIVTTRLAEFIQNIQLRNFFYEEYRDEEIRLDPAVFNLIPANAKWRTRPFKARNDTGFVVDEFGEAFDLQETELRFVRPGAIVKFANPADPTDFVFATVKSTINQGIPFDEEISEIGPVELSIEVRNDWDLVEVIPNFRRTFNSDEVQDIVDQILLRNPFGLGYDIDTDEWYIVTADNLDTDSNFSLDNARDQSSMNIDASWLVLAEFIPANNIVIAKYQFLSRGIRYVFESFEKVRFFNAKDSEVLDLETGRALRDEIEIMDLNRKPSVVEQFIFDAGVWVGTKGEGSFTNDHIVLRDRQTSALDIDVLLLRSGTSTMVDLTGAIQSGILDLNGIVTPQDSDILNIQYVNEREQLDEPIRWSIVDVFILEDGFLDPRKVEIAPADTDDDGVPDVPTSFRKFVDTDDEVFLERFVDIDGFEAFRPWIVEILDISDETIADVSVPGQLNGEDITEFVIIKDQSKLDTILQSDDPAYDGVIIYVRDQDAFFEIVIGSVPDPVTGSSLDALADIDHQAFNGRSFTLDPSREQVPLFFKWTHFSPRDTRIDPSISNIIDMFILTEGYVRQVEVWRNEGRDIEQFPPPPTTESLRIQFSELNRFKMLSDQIVFRPAKFKIMFGRQARIELRAKFRVVKIPTTLVTDNEIKSRVVEAIDEFFNLANFDFGEGFFYTELAAFIHERLINIIASVVIVPEKEESRFGNLFQVRAEPDELFLSTATVSDVEIVRNLTPTTLRIA